MLRSAAWAPVLTGAGGGDVQGTGRLVFDYTGTTSPAAAINTALGNGILRGSTADANHTLGYLDDRTGTVTVLPALYGDANFDGRISADDFALLDRGFARHLATWSDGDFNHDGQVSLADYSLIDRTYALQQGGALSPELLSLRESQFGSGYVTVLLASIPEPSSGGFLISAASMLLYAERRRRR